MNQTGHRSVQMVRRYIRDGSLFREKQCGEIGTLGEPPYCTVTKTLFWSGRLDASQQEQIPTSYSIDS